MRRSSSPPVPTSCSRCTTPRTGKPETDRSSVGIVLADGPPQQRHLTTTAISERDFEIPAGAPNDEVSGETVVNEAAKLVWIQPHMHYRARDYVLTVVYPSGEEKTILSVPNYRFDWQIGYELAEPLDLAEGHEVQDRRALRQLAREQVQSRTRRRT